VLVPLWQEITRKTPNRLNFQGPEKITHDSSGRLSRPRRAVSGYLLIRITPNPIPLRDAQDISHAPSPPVPGELLFSQPQGM
jgi:hypothetical protein